MVKVSIHGLDLSNGMEIAGVFSGFSSRLSFGSMLPSSTSSVDAFPLCLSYS